MTGATRHFNNIREDFRTLSMDAVVRDAFNKLTFGGGRVTLQKADLKRSPLSLTVDDDLWQVAVEQAVTNIINKGDGAYPKTRAPAGHEPENWKRRFYALAVTKNTADRPTRLDPFGGR